ncbi:MAG TPA: DNA-directed RNA polymerase subunit beta' [Bacilli bacterium]|nr:DNA-directed RNA polymerase subunit beta' [Bacilli bacterium]
MPRKTTFNINTLASVKIGLASPEQIRDWSHGEILKPETINYRSQKPERTGLFCEVIFGPSKDYECHCGKYRKIRFKGTVCEKCGVEVMSKYVRRERMGHIELASPCTHIWYLKGTPSRLAFLLDIPAKQLEEIIYFISHVVLDPGTSSVLEYKQFIDDASGRQIFAKALEEIREGMADKDSFEYARSTELLERLESSTFDFSATSRFISKYTGARFGEGAEAIKQLLKEVDLEKEYELIKTELKTVSKNREARLLKRLEIVDAFIKSGNKPEWMVLDVIPVIPPDLRPMLQLDGGRYANSDINDLYRRVITRNNRYKQLVQMNAPKVILMNGRRVLQQAVDTLIDNGRRGKPVTGTNKRPLKSLSAALKGKQGRFRHNLLGKRVDYSGRSVIAVGPELKMYECGIPREMAIQLFRPFIAAELIKREDSNVTNHTQADRVIDNHEEIVFDIIEEIIDDHPVLLNRAPTLHRLGIQAFKAVLVSGRAIRLHPLVCAGFNADFDGDQMAVHVPLSLAAKEEALNLMLASKNILGPKDGKPIAAPSQDMVIGNYFLTQEESKEDFLKRAAESRLNGDEAGALKFEEFAQSEGKVFGTVSEIIRAYETNQIHLHNRIALRGSALNKKEFTGEMNKSYVVTSVGKVIFNSIFPSDFPYINAPDPTTLQHNPTANFVPLGTNIKEHIAKTPLRKPIGQDFLGQIINEVFKRYRTTKTSAILDKIKDHGFKYATISGLTVSLADITPVEGKNELIRAGEEKVKKTNALAQRGFTSEEERYAEVIGIWQGVRNEVEDKLKEQFMEDRRNPLYIMYDSGARGKITNFVQLKGMRGLMASPRGGEIEIPIKSSFREGISVSEFFIASHGSRKGGADTAIKTADSGYLTRKLVDVAQDVTVTINDCGSDHGFVVREIKTREDNTTIVPLGDRIRGRYTVNDIIHPETGEVIVEANTLINEGLAEYIDKAGVEEVEIRSLFGCEAKRGVCAHCYGINLATGESVQVGEAVGIMAAQSIGEPGTQLTMRTFHTGGVATAEDVTQGLPRVQELFESRNPKGRAKISDISGTVMEIEEVENRRFNITVKNELEERVTLTEYGQKLRVKEGDVITSGQRLTEGTIFPRELLAVSDVTTVQNYLLNEVQKVYRTSASVRIDDKHLEVIVKQMLNRVLVIDGGETDLLPGQHVTTIQFTDANKYALVNGLRPAVAKPLILGITKAALASDSFLSAAGFQETTRILTDAVVKARIDTLEGLKENVITGRIIPAGRGLLSEEEQAALLEGFSVQKALEAIEADYEDDTLQ